MLVIYFKVAVLAETLRVQEPVRMFAQESFLVAALVVVAIFAHPICVVLSPNMVTLRNSLAVLGVETPVNSEFKILVFGG